MESRWEFCFLETYNRLHDKSQFSVPLFRHEVIGYE